MANRSWKRKRELEKQRKEQEIMDREHRWPRRYQYIDTSLYDPPLRDSVEDELYRRFRGKLLRPKLKERLLAMMKSPEVAMRQMANIIIEAKTEKKWKKRSKKG